MPSEVLHGQRLGHLPVYVRVAASSDVDLGCFKVHSVTLHDESYRSTTACSGMSTSAMEGDGKV